MHVHLSVLALVEMFDARGNFLNFIGRSKIGADNRKPIVGIADNLVGNHLLVLYK